MLGQMMQQPLLISSLLVHAERHHGRQEIVSRRIEGDIHRYTFRDMAQRSRQTAQALDGLGLQHGDRVATLAWNGHRHLELYFGVSGSGAVLHTVNPRLHEDQIVWIIENAEDDVLVFDLTFVDLVQSIAPRLTSVREFVVMTDRAHMPDVPDWRCYEDLLAQHDGDWTWPAFDELRASSLCYTSGTTGDPKGVLYSHRSTVLHTFGVALPDSLGLSASDVVMPVVPMFHVNAWGMPYGACMVGAKVVFPGADLDGASLHELIENEGVTLCAGVPTVWQGLLQHCAKAGSGLGSLLRAIVGGAACPPQMLRDLEETGVEVIHGWGMTETSPFGTASVLKKHQLDLPDGDRLHIKAKQGRCVFGIDLKITDDEGVELPWDGQISGHLMTRGHWVLDEYFGRNESPLIDGWFPTGDIASIDPDGFMQITDRSKDVIKSGGEWIGSIDLENIAMEHPDVAEAACIGIRHPKWDERPLLVVVPRGGAAPSREELIAWYADKIAKWWTPDDVVFVDSLPLGTTGKVLKQALRDRFARHFDTAPAAVV